MAPHASCGPFDLAQVDQDPAALQMMILAVPLIVLACARAAAAGVDFEEGCAQLGSGGALLKLVGLLLLAFDAF